MDTNQGIRVALIFITLAAGAGLFVADLPRNEEVTAEAEYADVEKVEPVPEPVLDMADYDARMRALARFDESAPDPYWPVADAPYPKYGALLPFHRVVAYYGNFYSAGMGVLGQYGEDEVADKLLDEVAAWEAADPTTPVVPAVDYIAVTAQWNPGADGLYRARMPGAQIDKAVALAEKVGGIVILEVQPGLSEMMDEVEALEPYLSLPQVHLAIDPEFAMIGRGLPGRVVGRADAAQVNAVAEYLAGLVRDYGLPPKMLVVHRYTGPMVTNAADIVPLPEVQVVMDMDGWGPPSQKIATYNAHIYPEPVQFTGFKLFYQNDAWDGQPLLTPVEILELTPRPIFIQYQ
jgi:hypothetical protein